MKHKKQHLKMRKEPVQPRSEFTINVILDATKHILKEWGLEELNTNTLAAIAGVSVGTIYQYFADTEAIIAELRRRHRVETNETVFNVIKSCDKAGVEDLLRLIITAVVDLHDKEAELHNILMKYAYIGTDDSFDDSKILNDELSLKVLEKKLFASLSIAPERVKLVNKVLFVMIDSLIHSSAINQELKFSKEALIEEVLCAGLGYINQASLVNSPST
jgi:AcrR family transcriptional regulator